MSSKDSKKQETKIARDIGGSTVPGSGCFACFPHDVTSDMFLVEAKYTDAKSYSLKQQSWKELLKNSIKGGKLPVFVIDFRMYGGDRLAVIRWEEFMDYLNRLREDD